MSDSFPIKDFSLLFRPQSIGNAVNSHVVLLVPEPQPDFAAMKRAIQGEPEPKPAKPEKHHDRPTND